MLRTALCHVPLSRSLVTPMFRLAQTAALRHPSLGLASSYSSAPARDALHARTFSSSPQRRAEEDPQLQHLFQQQQKLLKHLQNSPETVEHIKTFMDLLQQNGECVRLRFVRERGAGADESGVRWCAYGCAGVDPYSGKMPSKMAMLRLLMKPEIRESAMKMAEALQAAGIDMSQASVLTPNSGSFV
ncbi:hypothetical protein BC628DRAFT_1128525 [Trametes gibbosa]|nr:hypothetical protein BC628DRAFT_1128525 [Trametes gibbosa]